MPKSKLRLAILACLAVGIAALALPAAITPAASESYFSQRAMQNRDYSRMSTATQRAWKSEETTLASKKAKAKKKHKKAMKKAAKQ